MYLPRFDRRTTYKSEITKEEKKGYLHSRIDESFIKEHIDNFHQPFYICGPDAMILEINGLLTGLGASPEALVFEK